MDIYSKAKRSAIMSNIKGKGTQLEVRGWTLLRDSGVRFRRHPKGVYGNPDAGHKGKKIAIFFDSEFWHGFDWENRKKDFKSKKKFWIPKIERNIQRDKEVNRILKKEGWKVVRIWEKQMSKKNAECTIRRIKRKLLDIQ